MRQAAIKRISSIIAFLIGIDFVAKFAGPALLRTYVETGIGSCRKIPIFCMAPDDRIITPGPMDKDYTIELIPYRFPKMSISVPRGFRVVQEEIKRNYYKRKKKIIRIRKAIASLEVTLNMNTRVLCGV